MSKYNNEEQTNCATHSCFSIRLLLKYISLHNYRCLLFRINVHNRLIIGTVECGFLSKYMYDAILLTRDINIESSFNIPDKFSY